MTDEAYKYWAFISYSHQDAAWAGWLHKALESYSVPGRLAGRDGRFGPLPQRLFPIFRDREELSSSAELGGVINEALRLSRYQIVICSPRAAASRWVNEEIRYFKALGREDRVLALIVDGDPGASERGAPEFECFPLALRRRVDAHGALSAEPTEPIGADARALIGNRADARLKLIAGLLGVGYDELRQRERSRLFWQRLRILGTAAVLTAGIATLWQHQQDRRAEQAHQALLMRLFDLGRQELTQDHPARAATYLGTAYAEGLNTPALRLLLGRAMPPVDAIGKVRVHHADDAAGAVAWTPDGRRFITLWHNVKVWDAASGSALASFGNSEYSAMLGLTVSPDGRRLVVEGRRDFTEEPRSLDLYDLDQGTLLLHVDGGNSSSSTFGPAFRSLSPDSQKLLVLDVEGKVSQYRAEDGALLLRLATRDAASAGYSPDGRRIVTADTSGAINVWDSTSGRRLNGFASVQKRAVRAFFALDGRLIVIDDRGKLKIYDAERGQLLDALGGHSKEIKWAQFSVDGSRLLTNAEDGAKVWSLANGDELLHAVCQCSLAVGIDLNAAGTRLLSRIDPTRVGLWDVDEGSLLQTLDGHSSEVNGMLFSPDSAHLLTAAVDGDALIWNTEMMAKQPLIKLQHDRPLNRDDDAETYSGRYSPDGSILVTVGNDGTARLWNAADGSLLHVLRGHAKTVYHAAFSPDGKQLATASDDLTARLWDVGSGATQAILDGHNRFVRRVVYSADGSRLLTVAGTEARIWDTRSGKLVAKLVGHTEPAVDGSFSADGTRVLTTGIDGSPRIFDAASGSEMVRMTGHAGVVPFAAFVDDDRKVISAGVDGSVRIWSSNDGRALAESNQSLAGAGGFRNGTLSHDGSRALLSASTGELLLWHWREGGFLRLTGHSVASYWTEFSADDRFAVSAGNDGSARVWDIASGLQLQIFKLPSRITRLWSAGFNHDATRVLTAGQAEPPTAEIWDIHQETRDAATLARVLRCKSPWQVEGERLVAHRPDTANCDVSEASSQQDAGTAKQ